MANITKTYPEDRIIFMELSLHDDGNDCTDDMHVNCHGKSMIEVVENYLELASFRFLGIPLPRFLWLRAWGHERADEEGRFTFDVGIALPFGLDLVTYKGWLVEGSD
jgi:hypothetical protein